jgi:hypothetical protein
LGDVASLAPLHRLQYGGMQLLVVAQQLGIQHGIFLCTFAVWVKGLMPTSTSWPCTRSQLAFSLEPVPVVSLGSKEIKQFGISM